MQNSLCGDQGGLRFNIHADLEEMLITGLGNLHFCLILLLPGCIGRPPSPFSPPLLSPEFLPAQLCQLGWAQRLPECLSAVSPCRAGPIKPLSGGGGALVGSHEEELGAPGTS